MIKKNRTLFFFLLLLGQYACAGTNTDSLVRSRDLLFVNETERIAFSEFIKEKESGYILNLFLTPYNKNGVVNTESIHKAVNECVNYLKIETANKSEPKKIKYIYEYVHKAFLKVYKLKNSFSDIFEKGEYNCVSASALYAVIFSKLGIAFQIMETPQHVYLVALSNTEKILIETTSPEKGYYQFSDDFIKKYVTSLLNSKIISKQESDTTTATRLFNKYYFSSENISLIQLAGLQHNNFGLYYAEDKKYEESISEFKKAYFLYPCERNRFMLKSVLMYQIANSNYQDQKQVDHLAMLCHYKNANDNEISNETIKSEFSRITENQLINNSEYEKYENSYQKITTSLNDTSLINDINFTYHSELARLGLINSKEYEYEMTHLRGAYKSNPRNANLQALILGYFSTRIRKDESVKSVLDLLNDFGSKFDFLRNNLLYANMRANCLLELAYQSIAVNELSKGESQLKEFETLCMTNKSIEPTPSSVEKAYAVAAGTYYKKGNYAKAKQLLKTGLIYAPGNFGLKQRLSQF
jgi:hypothetical protein